MTSQRQQSHDEGSASLLDNAIADVSAAIELHAADKPAPFSGPVLLKVLGELGRMKREPGYLPEFPRELHGSGSDLGKKLTDLALRRKSALRK